MLGFVALLPNTRLKLSAPVPTESGERFTGGVVEFCL